MRSWHPLRRTSSSGVADPGARPGAASARLLAAICLVGVALTASASWAAWRADRNTEERLLEVQTRQAASVLTAAVQAIEQPLRAALAVDRGAGGGSRGAAAVREVLAAEVGADARYLSASMWRSGSGSLRPVVSLGASSAPLDADPARRELRERALRSDTTVVGLLDREVDPRIAYAIADRVAGTVVYAERAIPADRRAPVDRDSAYAGLSYAIYLGPTTSTRAMTTTNADPARLPLDGVTDVVTVPFGDTVLTLVTAPRTHLGSPLSQRLPWLLLLGGLLLTGLAAVVAAELSRARSTAEADTATIRTLYERVDAVYGEQRELFVALQRALLPRADPHIPRIEVAADYVAGAIGIDIGGDWYSILRIDDDRFAFVVGDVSGRGVEAVAEMARARFTLRAYLLDGDSPGTALAKASAQFDVVEDGHIVTALVAVGDCRTGAITVADAGHPPPLMAAGATVDYVPVPAGPPLGYGPAGYDEHTFTMPAGSTLVCYTDGLVERRTEDIDVGLARLRRTVTASLDLALPELVADLLTTMADDDAPDDTAVLALRRLPPTATSRTAPDAADGSQAG